MGSRWWGGAAEDGAVAAVGAPAGWAEQVVAHWPRVGLARSEGRPATADLEVAVEEGERGSVVARVDGAAAHGGWDRVESALDLFAAEHLVGRVAVHAAVVVWEGRALVLPGRSHSGKSTLALALADRGAEVWSDEYAVVDPRSGAVSPWPRPVRQRRPGQPVDRVLVPEPTASSAPVGLIAFLRYDPAEPEPIAAVPEADVVLRLLDNTVSAQRSPEVAFEAALALARRAPAVAGTRGEAPDAATALLALLNG